METRKVDSTPSIDESDDEYYLCQDEKEVIKPGEKQDSLETYDIETPPCLDPLDSISSTATLPSPLTDFQRQRNYPIRLNRPGAYLVTVRRSRVSFSDDDDDSIRNESNPSSGMDSTETIQQNHDIIAYPYPLDAELVEEESNIVATPAVNTNQTTPVANSDIILVKAEPMYPDDNLKGGNSDDPEKASLSIFHRRILLVLYIVALSITASVTVGFVLKLKHEKSGPKQVPMERFDLFPNSTSSDSPPPWEQHDHEFGPNNKFDSNQKPP